MEAAQDGMFPCSGDEPFADNGPSEAAVAGALPRELQQDASAAARDALCVRYGSIRVRVSYAGECSIEEAVSRYLAASENVRDGIGKHSINPEIFAFAGAELLKAWYDCVRRIQESSASVVFLAGSAAHPEDISEPPGARTHMCKRRPFHAQNQNAKTSGKGLSRR